VYCILKRRCNDDLSSWFVFGRFLEYSFSDEGLLKPVPCSNECRHARLDFVPEGSVPCHTAGTRDKNKAMAIRVSSVRQSAKSWFAREKANLSPTVVSVELSSEERLPGRGRR